MNFLIHISGVECYRCDELLPLRAGEEVIYIDPAEGEDALQVRLAARQQHTVNTARTAALARVNDGYTAATAVLSAGYPDAERASWDIQVEEAKDATAADGAATPWLDAAAGAREIDRMTLAAKILALNTAYRSIHGTLSGTRQRLESTVMDPASTIESLAKISWATLTL